MKSETIKEIILERNPQAIFLRDKFDEALIGTSIQCGKKHVATYESNKCVEILMEETECDELEAYEYFRAATEGIESKDNSPILFSDFRNAKIPEFPEMSGEMSGDMTLEDIL